MDCIMNYKYCLTALAIVSLITGCKDSQLSLTGYVSSMACSKAFVSGFSRDQINKQDLQLITNGSSKNAEPSINNERQSVSSKILTTQKTAIYRQGLGCTLVGEVSGISDESTLRRQVMPDIYTPVLDENSPWPMGKQGVVEGVLPQKYNAINAAADVQFSENKAYQVATHSIAIAHKGQLVYERYAQGISPQTPLYGFSLGKTLATLLAGKLSANGELNVHQPLALQAWQDVRADISSHHLLTMTSGLQFDESYEDATSDANMLFVADDMAELSINKAANAPAGQEFKYSTANSLIFAEYLNQRLGGLENTYTEFQNLMRQISVNNAVVQADGHGTMTFGMQDLISTRDLLRIGQFMLQKGRWNEQEVIPESWFDYMQTPVIASMRVENKLKKSYGAGIWLNLAEPYGKTLPSLPEDAYLGLGMRGQYVIVIPSQELVIVRTGTTLDLDSFDYLNDIDLFSSVVFDQLSE
jgi:CubicO group peptidase (beta-lactamase class C family)